MHEAMASAFAQALDTVVKLKGKDQKRIHRAMSFSESTYQALDFPPSLMAEDHEYAQSLGLEFQRSDRLPHDEAVDWLHDEIAKADADSIFRAFVVGLNPKQALWRAPMRAYAAYAHLPKHGYDPDTSYHERICKECGLTKFAEWKPVGLALMMTDGSLGYSAAETIPLAESALSLNWFRTASPPAPSPADLALLESVLDALDQADPETTANGLDAVLKPMLKGDKYSRRAIIETLGLMGVLTNPRQAPDIDQWTPWEKRDFGKHKNQEIIPPACTWRRSEGVNTDRLRATQ